MGGLNNTNCPGHVWVHITKSTEGQSRSKVRERKKGSLFASCLPVYVKTSLPSFLSGSLAGSKVVSALGLEAFWLTLNYISNSLSPSSHRRWGFTASVITWGTSYNTLKLPSPLPVYTLPEAFEPSHFLHEGNNKVRWGPEQRATVWSVVKGGSASSY